MCLGNMNGTHYQRFAYQQGIGLVEVLVAMLLLAISLLGFSAMQLRAIKATGDSLAQTQALAIIRSVSEKIRVNPSAIGDYQTNFDRLYQAHKAGTTITPLASRCGMDGVRSDTLCNAVMLAQADTYEAYLWANRAGVTINMVTCPAREAGQPTALGDTISEGTISTQSSHCVLVAWNQTTPTKGDNMDTDCISDTPVADKERPPLLGGIYYPKASCMFMEID